MRLVLLLSLLFSWPVAAENIVIPLEQQGDLSLPLPAQGASQKQILERFGLPDLEHPPVGSPRMSRWDYRYFSVYFENERVITSVRHHQPKYPQPQPAQEQP